MDTIVVPKAVEIAARLRNAQRLRVFEEAAADFVRLIGMVPDCAPHALSVTEVTTLRHLAEGVIEQIEARLRSSVCEQNALHTTDGERVLGRPFK